MSKAISITDLSKLYKLGVVGYGSLKDDITSLWARFRGKEDPNAQIGKESRLGQHGEFWALRNITFEVQQGDRVGIIGRNGAGKSTLLKVLSRITAPTSGNIKIKGRISSLLEVGTGFHPELTGRENVYLNGAILGMKRREIQRKFDEIVEFAGVTEFIDTPVKRYSSGMYVRLAFSVAAHLDSEILIIDEVLAVGDSEFQNKCLGKMEYVSEKQGRTVLFVSHSMDAIRKLCNRGLLLNSGMTEVVGNIDLVIDQYINRDSENLKKSKEMEIDDKKDFQLIAFQVADSKNNNKDIYSADEDIHITLYFLVRKLIPGVYGYLSLSNIEGTLIYEGDSHDSLVDPFPKFTVGKNGCEIIIPKRLLGHGEYIIYLNFASLFSIQDFNVDSPAEVGRFKISDELSSRGNNRRGFISTRFNWKHLEVTGE